jgi:hypothetical protein
VDKQLARQWEASGQGADPDLVDLAAGCETDDRSWRQEFRWFLGHPAVSAVSQSRGAAQSLTLQSIAGEYATRFPRVSGDAGWLQQRSMVVVARRLAAPLAAGSRVGLDLSVVARGDCPAGVRREQAGQVAAGLRDALPQALSRLGVAPAGLALSIAADHPGLGAVLRLRECASLGRPQVIVRIPDRLMLALNATGDAAGREAARRLFQGITLVAHREPGVRLVHEHTTRPACSLAWGERGDAVLPDSLFEARSESAWLALGIRLDALGPCSMAEGLGELRRLFRVALRLADNVVEQLDWSSVELAQDALVNRRLAVHLTGIGDLVDRWNLDPAAFGSVRLVSRWLAMLRSLMLRESNALARARGPFPGLELRELARSLAASLGEERAGRLLRQAGLRHRHLLVLSPYSLFPERASRRPLPAYLHLLPAIRVADTIGMRGDGIARALPLGGFRRLVQMSWVVARNRP